MLSKFVNCHFSRMNAYLEAGSLENLKLTLQYKKRKPKTKTKTKIVNYFEIGLERTEFTLI